MRWIATLVATCLVALGAMRAPRPQASDREGHEPAIEDANGLVAKLAPRRPTAIAPDKRAERLHAVIPAPPPPVDRPAHIILAGTLAAPRATAIPHLLARTSRGPPLGSSFGIVPVS